eukprot:jgi/Mesen1/3287/ME001906S02383
MSGTYEQIDERERILAQLRQETSSMIGREMQVSPEQGQFLAMLVKLMGATRCIEVGVYTELAGAWGYSSVSVALALPEGGTLVACERVAPTLAVARKYYALAGVAHKVRRHMPPPSHLLPGPEAITLTDYPDLSSLATPTHAPPLTHSLTCSLTRSRTPRAQLTHSCLLLPTCAGMGTRSVDVREGMAQDTLAAMLAAGEAN